MLKRMLVIALFISSSIAVCAHEDDTRSITRAIRAVPIVENGEPLVDLKEQTVIAYSAKFVEDYPGCTKIRKTVYEKLCQAQKLLPDGVRFEVDEGLRSLKTQALLFDEMYKQMQKNFPQMGEKELFLETSKFVAPVKTWEGHPNVSPHSTGGAIDVILIDLDGKPVDMGINPLEPYHEDLICTDSPFITKVARENRDAMAKALSAVGFVNYPDEFWHWSYGDRRWAHETHAPHAIYGPILEE